MLVTITNTQPPATDLGFLLHKNPARLHSRELTFGIAHVFYPIATENECTAVLLLEIDPVGLVRGRPGSHGEGGLLEQYVNDRPYVASSLLSVALGQLFGTALSGRCKDRPELADSTLLLRIELPVVPCRGGDEVVRSLFEPLGYFVETEQLPLDPNFPEWGQSRYFRIVLTAMQRVCDALAHLYVLIPVLDADKHYWVGEDEIDKLLRRGKGWLESHPAKEEIANRYLRRKRRLTQIALAQLTDNTLEEAETADERRDAEEESTEKPIRLNDVRHAAVFDVIKASGASRIVDLGCGEGKLLYRFLDDKQFTEILGVDVSMRALEVASDRLHLDTMPEIRRKRIRLLQSSLTYLDDRLQGFDAGCAVEVIEHLDPDRLTAFERTVFGFVQPNTLVVTTPNVEYNAMFPAMPAGRLRHRDHRFEWTREQFRAWASGVAERYAYRLRFEPVGPDDPEVGPPTQMAVFER